MKNLIEITNKFGNTIVQNYNDAIKLGISDYGFNEDDILERKEKVTIEINNEIKEVELYCIFVDSGSNDYIYFLEY